jgi:hypothetical protein
MILIAIRMCQYFILPKGTLLGRIVFSLLTEQSQTANTKET